MAETNSIWKQLPGPESIRRTQTKNGITVLTFPNIHTRSVYLIGMMESGSAHEPREKLGLAHFTAGMLTRGTQKRPFSEFHTMMEEKGANLGFTCSTRHTSFSGRALAEDADLLIDLAADGLIRPAFEEQYVERLRGQLLASLAIREQDTSENVSMVFDRLLFPGHPFGDPVDGFPETIRDITREDMMAFHDRYYSPRGMIIAAAGGVDPQEIAQLVEKHFGEWQGAGERVPDVPDLPPGPNQIIRSHKHLEDKSQVDLEMGCYGPARTSDDYIPVYLGNNILGQFGLMGRIGDAVRSKAGLAYSASSSVSGWDGSGTWEFGAGTSPDNLEQAIELIRGEIRRYLAEPVTQEELDDSRSHLIGRMPLSLESNPGLANALLTMERFGLGLDYYQKYPGRLKKISAQDILEASRKYLDADKLVVASAGPREDIP